MSIVDDVKFLKLSKKDQEREILNGFLERLDYEAEIDDSERPDFVIAIGGQRIGVEVTKYFTDESRKGSRVERIVGNWKDKIRDETFLKPQSDWPTPPFQSGYIDIDSGFVSEIVRKKEMKAVNFGQGFSQTWLLIFAHGVGYHDMYFGLNKQSLTKEEAESKRLPTSPGISESEVEAKYFSHIFVWDKFTETIYLVFPYRKVIFSHDAGVSRIYVNHLPLRGGSELLKFS